MIRISIFASGSGTNADNIVRSLDNNKFCKVSLILTNNPKAGVIERAKKLGIPCKVLSKQDFVDGDGLLQILKNEGIDFIVLAGFLLLVNPSVINFYKGKIINIHPSLLPLHCGKGFYGSKVHQSVILAREIMSGITIHHVNEKFDEGEIIFQAACHVDKNDTPDSLAEKIHLLEYAYYPVVIVKTIQTVFN